MGKRRSKATNSLMMWLGMILTLVVSVGVGGLFINGTFESVVLLKFLPSIVHQVVGWILVVGGLGKFVMDLL